MHAAAIRYGGLGHNILLQLTLADILSNAKG